MADLDAVPAGHELLASAKRFAPQLRDNCDMKLAFLLAGVQKGGTTALHHFLRQHRRIFLPDTKELHFFDNEGIDWPCPDYERLYHAHFADAAPTMSCGEATPIYTYWTPAHERIRAYNPDIKFIISLRDPAERAYSHWRMETVRGAETISFSEAIRSGRRRVASDSASHGCHRVFSYVERGFYFEQLVRLASFFSRENILLLDQWDLKTRHEPTLDRICDFLEIERFKTYPAARTVFSHGHTPVPRMSPDDRSYLNDVFDQDLMALRDTFGFSLKRHQYGSPSG